MADRTRLEVDQDIQRRLRSLERRLLRLPASVLPSRGSTLFRDATYPAPTTVAEQVDLANKKVTWYNTDLGWAESYYAPDGSAGLTAVGLVAGPPAGWYPLPGSGPFARLQGAGAQSVVAGTEYSNWRPFGEVANADGLGSYRNSTLLTVSGSWMAPLIWGRFAVAATFTSPNGTGSGFIAFANWRSGSAAWDLQQGVTLSSVYGLTSQWDVREVLLRPNDHLFLRSVSVTGDFGGGPTAIAATYLGPPTVSA